MIHAVSCKDDRPAPAAQPESRCSDAERGLRVNELGPRAVWKVRRRATVRYETHNKDDVSKALQMLRCEMHGWSMNGV